MYLFFDTETTRLPKNWKAPASDVDNWPRLVQIAWIQYDKIKQLVSSRDYIVKPQGFEIPKDAEKVHRISTERALREGRPLHDVLAEFAQTIASSDFLIGHNIDFDDKIIHAELIREKVSHHLDKKKKICTMKSSVDFCRLPGNFGYKWPTLSELHRKLFNTDFEEAHNALVDVSACAKCFWELVNRGVLR